MPNFVYAVTVEASSKEEADAVMASRVDPAFPADLDVRAALSDVFVEGYRARAALDDEHEGNFRKAVLELADKADALRAWVKGA